MNDTEYIGMRREARTPKQFPRKENHTDNLQKWTKPNFDHTKNELGTIVKSPSITLLDRGGQGKKGVIERLY